MRKRGCFWIEFLIETAWKQKQLNLKALKAPTVSIEVTKEFSVLSMNKLILQVRMCSGNRALSIRVGFLLTGFQMLFGD